MDYVTEPRRLRRRRRPAPLLLLILAAVVVMGLLAAVVLSLRDRRSQPEPETDPHAGQVYVNDGANMVWLTPHEGFPVSALPQEDFRRDENEDGTPGQRVRYIGADYATRWGVDVSNYQGTIDWAALKAQGVEYAVLTLKDAAGNIYYASQAAAAAGGIVAEPLDAGHIAAILREEKLIPVAQLAAFKDPISPRTDPSMAIHYNGSALWLDAQKNGNPWLNPYSTAAVEYVGDLVEEVQQLGFEQVVLTNVQFPKLSKKQDYGTTNGVSRADQLKADIAALQDRLSGKVTLWFSYTLDQCKNSSVALDVPALTLGVQNLLVTSDAAMDADALQALETAATDAGVENLTVHAADRFETDRVSG